MEQLLITVSNRKVPATTFTCFKKLPPELCNMIWEHAAKPKRITTITALKMAPQEHTQSET
jgi:hypothetical protein